MERETSAEHGATLATNKGLFNMCGGLLNFSVGLPVPNAFAFSKKNGKQNISFSFSFSILKKKSIKMSTTLKYKGGRYCCVTGCNSRQGREDIRFFRFPTRNPEQFELWVKAVKRENFHPNSNTAICAKHFASGEPGNRRDSPDYFPTIFPTVHMKAKTEADLARFERVRSFDNTEER